MGKKGDVLTNPYDFVKSTNPIEYTGGIQALTDVEVEYISYHQIQEVIAQYPEVSAFASEMLSKYYLHFFCEFTQMQALSPRERFDKFISTHADMYDHIPLKYIASYLAISPECLSRYRAMG